MPKTNTSTDPKNSKVATTRTKRFPYFIRQMGTLSESIGNESHTKKLSKLFAELETLCIFVVPDGRNCTTTKYIRSLFNLGVSLSASASCSCDCLATKGVRPFLLPHHILNF